MLKFYGYKKCSTCRKAEMLLTKSGVEYKFFDITQTPPSASALDKMMKPGMGAYDTFKNMFEKYSKEAGKKQYPLRHCFFIQGECS